MLELTIGIIGRISVGKSTITKLISQNTGIDYTSFGSFLVKYCTLNNIPKNRESLQDIGDKFIKSGPKLFLEMVLQDFTGSKNKVILEGIRHSAILNEVKVISKNTFLIYLDASPETRYLRDSKRKKESDTKLTFEDFLEKDSHVVESEIEMLKPLCDLIINSDQLDVNQTVEQILSIMHSKGLSK